MGWLVIVVAAVSVFMLSLAVGIRWHDKWENPVLYDRVSVGINVKRSELEELFFSRGELGKRVEERFRPLVELLSRNGAYLSTSDIDIITNGKEKLSLLEGDILSARESIHMEYFHFGIDSGSRRIRELLMEKARSGIKVRFINENIANLPIPSIYFHRMRYSGVEVVNFTRLCTSPMRFLSSLNYRDHRKIVVIDGKIGYTGGMNINNHYFYQWRDTHIRMEGSAVNSLQLSFLDTWLRCGGRLISGLGSYFPEIRGDISEGGKGDILTQVVWDGPSSSGSLLYEAYEWIIRNAERYIWIQSPYLAPPSSLIEVMRNSVKRGVSIRIMVPEYCDTFIMRPINKMYYSDMVEAGVELYVRSGEFIHSKSIICDDYLSCIGTTNLDYRSFGVDYEINTFFYDSSVAKYQRSLIERDLPICQLLTYDDIGSLSYFAKSGRGLLRKIVPYV